MSSFRIGQTIPGGLRPSPLAVHEFVRLINEGIAE